MGEPISPRLRDEQERWRNQRIASLSEEFERRIRRSEQQARLAEQIWTPSWVMASMGGDLRGLVEPVQPGAVPGPWTGARNLVMAVPTQLIDPVARRRPADLSRTGFNEPAPAVQGTWTGARRLEID